MSEDTDSEDAMGDDITREQFLAFYGMNSFDGPDDLLSIWFCRKCYLDPSDKPPNFETCLCCLEMYYFPFPPTLPEVWLCPGCKRLQKGILPAIRQCNQCGKEEQITMRVPNERF